MAKVKPLFHVFYVDYIKNMLVIFLENKQIKEKERLEISYMVMQDVNYQLFAESVQEECLLGIKILIKIR